LSSFFQITSFGKVISSIFKYLIQAFERAFLPNFLLASPPVPITELPLDKATVRFLLFFPQSVYRRSESSLVFKEVFIGSEPDMWVTALNLLRWLYLPLIPKKIWLTESYFIFTLAPKQGARGKEVAVECELKFSRIGLTIDSFTRNRLMNRKISQVVVVVDQSQVKYRFLRHRLSGWDRHSCHEEICLS